MPVLILVLKIFGVLLMFAAAINVRIGTVAVGWLGAALFGLAVLLAEA